MLLSTCLCLLLQGGEALHCLWRRLNSLTDFLLKGWEILIIREDMGEETENTSLLVRLFCRRFTVLWRTIWSEKTTATCVLFKKERWRWRDVSSQNGSS